MKEILHHPDVRMFIPLFTHFHKTGYEYHINMIIALMMEVVSTSERSVNMYQTTRRNIPEGSHLHTRRRESLKSHITHLFYYLLPFRHGDKFCRC
jgi:hypothetical protein